MWDLFPTELVTKLKPNINSVEVHPQQSNNGHPVDGALVGAGSLWPNNNIMMTTRYANLPPNPPNDHSAKKKIHMNIINTNAHEKHYLMENGTPSKYIVHTLLGIFFRY